MADKIKGITVEIGGDTVGLQNALKDTNKEISSTQRELKEVERLLKLDPSNTTILTQKQKLLADQIKNTTTKLDALKQARDKAEANGNIDKNSEEYRKLEREIVATEQALGKLEDGFKNAGKEAENSANGGFTVFKGVVANLATDVIEGAITGIKNLGTAMVEAGKQALDSYANYEQLAGGVDTLFGKDSQQVTDNANKAFQTAGLSANEYMETVTSFSASLLQSLNGDTAESAKVADMAIIDMADNANKMGTSMESIQNAYQGFAKQNYTMLDNLKLGYGGTKTEMERLLKDAEELSGQKYDISSLSDVYEAIHVIQTEMGVTGTTAKEATQTISGSIDSLGSAYQNLLTGLADENADVGVLLDNVVNSALNVFDNVAPRIQEIANKMPNLINKLVQKINEHLPEIIAVGMSIVSSLGDGIMQNAGEIMNMALNIITTLVTALLENLPSILQMGIDLITQLATGIAKQLPTLIPLAIEAILNLVTTLIDNIDQVIDAGISLIIGLADGLIEGLPTLIEKIPEIITKIVTRLTDPDMTLKLIEAAFTLMVKLGEGLIKAIPELLKAVPKIIKGLVDTFSKNAQKVRDIGKNLVQGIFNGIQDAKQWLWDKLTGWCDSVLDFIKGMFGIESPSKVMRDKVGKFMAEGIGVGFTKEMPSVISDMEKSLSGVTLSMAQLSMGEIPSATNRVTTQNFYTTRNMTSRTEVVRQPSTVILQVDKRELGRVVVPAYNSESNRIGVVMG